MLSNPTRTLRAGISQHGLSIESTSSICASCSRVTHSKLVSLPIGQKRCFARVRDVDVVHQQVFFGVSNPKTYGDPRVSPEYEQPDERTLQLGRTVRELHERLPTLLLSPLPSEILSPQITLHLFPSTHPHLPTVSGRIGYVAALWTAPVAWGRVPLVGNVKLTILSERMVRNGGGPSVAPNDRNERLVVKWKTCGKTDHRDGTGGIYRGVGIGMKDPVDRIKEFIAGASQGNKEKPQEDEEFCGIFVFEFDDKGRISKHIIEHTDEGGHWEKTARVVSVTDWLLGQINGKNQTLQPSLALCEKGIWQRQTTNSRKSWFSGHG